LDRGDLSSVTLDIQLSGTATSDDYSYAWDSKPTLVWTKSWIDNYLPIVKALAPGLDGSIYACGDTAGSFDGQTFSGGVSDGVLTKYSAGGEKT